MSVTIPLFPQKIRGPQGPTGPQGATGATGPTSVGSTATLANVLLAGNSAGISSINMSNNNITNASLINGLQISSGVIADNVNIGLRNLNLTTTGLGNNIAIGDGIMPTITTGSYNLMVGSLAGGSITSGQGNNGYGSSALNKITNGSFNVAVGNRAGERLIAGSYNVYIGSQAGEFGTTGNEVTAIGQAAGRNNTGDKNTFIGAGSSITGGVSNSTVVGHEATTGVANTIQLGKSNQNVNCPNTLSVASTCTFGDTITTSIRSPIIQGAITGSDGITIRNNNGNTGNLVIQNNATTGSQNIVFNTSGMGQGIMTFSPQNTLALTISPATCSFPNACNYSSNGTTALSGVNNVLSTTFQKEFYLVDATAEVQITLADPSFINMGQRITFRRSAGTATITLTTYSGGNQVVPNNSITAGVNATMINTEYTSTFFCNGTLWYQATY